MKYKWIGFLVLTLLLAACGLEQPTPDQAVAYGEPTLQSKTVQTALKKAQSEYGLTFDLSKVEEGYAPSGSRLLKVFTDDKSATFSVGLVGDRVAFIDVDKLSGNIGSLSAEDSLLSLYENLDVLSGSEQKLEDEGANQPSSSSTLSTSQVKKQCTPFQRSQISIVRSTISRLGGDRIRAQGTVNLATYKYNTAKSNYRRAQAAVTLCAIRNFVSCVGAVFAADRAKWAMYFAKQDLDRAVRALADIDRRLRDATWTLTNYIGNWPECF